MPTGPNFLPLDPIRVVVAAWTLLAVYWIVGAFSAKPTAKQQPSAERVMHLALVVIAFLLLYRNDLPWTFLYRRFVPDVAWIAWTGAAATFVGACIAIWARRTIGKDWSAEVQIKEGHELVRRGPYRFIRHPIYTGLLTSVAGTALLLGQVRGLVAFAVVLFAFVTKAKKEEAFLAGEFGASFEEHKRYTGFFLPRMR